jgi:outer membrane protein TolC
MSDAEVDIGWTLDLAGRQHEMVRATRTFARSTALQVEAAKVALSGSVAQAYVNLARAEAQERIAREFLANREASLKLTQNRRAAALATEIDIAAAQTLLAQARQALVRAEGQRALMVHALAALAGRGADYYGAIGPTSLRPEATLPVPQSLPADLLARRADLLAAQLQVEMAAHGEKIQRAAFYPDVNLQALRGFRRWGSDRCLRAARPWRALARRCTCPSFRAGR